MVRHPQLHLAQRLRHFVLGAVLLAALWPSAASGARRAIVTKLVTDTGVVQPGQDSGFSQRCPDGVPHAVGSELYLGSGAPEGQIALDESNAIGIRGHSWDIGVLGIGDQPQVFTAATICLRARGRFVYPSHSAVLKAGENRNWSIHCPPSAPHALNGTLEPQTDAGVGKLEISQSTPLVHQTYGTTRRWYIGVRNVSSEPQGYYVGAVCTSARLTMASLFTGSRTIPPLGTEGFAARCPRRAPHPIASAFYPLDPSGFGQLAFSQIAPFKGRGLSTRVTNRGSTAERTILGQVCIG